MFGPCIYVDFTEVAEDVVLWVVCMGMHVWGKMTFVSPIIHFWYIEHDNNNYNAVLLMYYFNIQYVKKSEFRKYDFYR